MTKQKDDLEAFQEWMSTWIREEWISPIWCYVHDTPPLSNAEQATLDANDGDLDVLCLPSVRLLP